MQYLDIAKFKTSPKPERYVFTNVFFILLFAVIFYIGMYANYWLLDEAIPEYMNIVFIIAIAFLLIIEAVVSYVKYGQYYYVFYDKRLEMKEVKKVSINYESIRKIAFKENLFDRWFKTSTIVIKLDSSLNNKTFKIKNIVDGNQIYFYLQKMIKTNE